MKIVVYQYNERRREEAADALRSAGYAAYAARTPEAAYEAVRTLRPDIVLTDFPALLLTREGQRHTLTEAIRANDELAHVTVLNLPNVWSRELEDLAAAAGVDGTIPAAPTAQHVLNAVHQWSARPIEPQ
jgi:CheY-like chemotaxis protein